MDVYEKSRAGSCQGPSYFTNQLMGLHRKVLDLIESPAEDLVPVLLEELKLSVQMLAAQDQVLVHLNGEVERYRRENEVERKRCHEMVYDYPVACIVTDMGGKIREANREAAALLNIHEKLLAGKYLTLFIDEAGRRDFNQQVEGRFRASRRLIYKTRLMPCQKASIEATFTVSAELDGPGGPVTLRFMLNAPG